MNNAIKSMLVLAALSFVVILAGCGGGEPDDTAAAGPPNAQHKNLFGGMPKVMESKDNPLTDAKIALGRILYYEPRMSVSSDISCNSCHLLDEFGVAVPGQPAVPFATGYQFALECPNGHGHVVEGDWLVLAGEGGFEQRTVLRDAPQHFLDRFGRRHSVFHRVENRPLGLGLDRGIATIPELGHMDGGVVDRRAVPHTEGAVVAG